VIKEETAESIRDDVDKFGQVNERRKRELAMI